MRRLLPALPAAAVALVFSAFPSSSTDVAQASASTTTTTAAPPPPPPRQDLPPGAVKHPGEKCATVVQPPENQGCPGPPDDLVGPHHDRHYCTGSAYAIGECVAAEHAFFNPPNNFQPRNATEACIDRTENGGGYDRSRNLYHEGRWQASRGVHERGGGQPGDWDSPPSPAEQDMVFVTVADRWGYGDWTPWDGC